MDRRPPRSTSDEIDLYINTYYSLLRSSGDVRVRAFEEAHLYSSSSLHEGARLDRPDIAAFAYSAARLPECMPEVRRIVLGQSQGQFFRAGMDVSAWQKVRARGRRRAMRISGDTLAVFVTSASDIDDLVPIVTAYQIEWNKMHGAGTDLGLGAADRPRLEAALARPWVEVVPLITSHECDVSIRLLNGSFNQYQRSVQKWWAPIETRIEPATQPRRVYFVSSNTHSLVNLVGGYARIHRQHILDFARKMNPEGLAPELERLHKHGSAGEVDNILYYCLRAYLHDTDVERRRAEVQQSDNDSGITTIESPGRVDVSAQLIEVSRIHAERVDPRVRVDGIERLKGSNALIVNIDYPLGLAAYHHLSRLAQGASNLCGVYVLGKAATLNGRVGDVMVSDTIYDEHSKNTYLFANRFQPEEIQPYMREGTVLDNQKAVTVRSAFLQNRRYMSVFYNEGYTVMEMEAGPYLSAVYEIVSPRRHPMDELVNLSSTVPFDLGILHYASDTPYSRRQSLLSKSMSYFGVESTYACSIAILRRILRLEIAHLTAEK